MAKNRDEQKSSTNANIVAELAISTDVTERLDTLDNIRFRKDVKQTITATASATAVDWSGKDFTFVNCVTNGIAPVFSFSNLDDGDVKYLSVSKDPNDALSFSGVTDITEYPARYTAASDLLFLVLNKNGITYVKMLSANLGGAWHTLTLSGAWVNDDSNYPARYRVDEFGYIEIIAAIRTSSFSQVFANLPAGFRPDYNAVGIIIASNDATTRVEVDSAGDCYIILDAAIGGAYYINLRFKQTWP